MLGAGLPAHPPLPNLFAPGGMPDPVQQSTIAGVACLGSSKRCRDYLMRFEEPMSAALQTPWHSSACRLAAWVRSGASAACGSQVVLCHLSSTTCAACQAWTTVSDGDVFPNGASEQQLAMQVKWLHGSCGVCRRSTNDGEMAPA